MSENKGPLSDEERAKRWRSRRNWRRTRRKEERMRLTRLLLLILLTVSADGAGCTLMASARHPKTANWLGDIVCPLTGCTTRDLNRRR